MAEKEIDKSEFEVLYDKHKEKCIHLIDDITKLLEEDEYNEYLFIPKRIMIDLINHHDEMTDMADRITGISNTKSYPKEPKEERFSERVRETKMEEIPKEVKEVKEKPKKFKKTFFDLDENTQRVIVQRLDEIFKLPTRDRLLPVRRIMVEHDIKSLGDTAKRILERYKHYLKKEESEESLNIKDNKEKEISEEEESDD